MKLGYQVHSQARLLYMLLGIEAKCGMACPKSQHLSTGATV